MIKSPLKYGPYHYLPIVILLFVFLIAVNLFFSNLFFRFDLSEDKIHTLSKHTKTTLADLDEIINVEVYIEGVFPAEIEKLKKSLNEKLAEFKAYGGQNFKYKFIDLNEDPAASKERKNQIYNDGLDPAYVQIYRDSKVEELEIWPGLILRMGDQFEPVQLLQGGKFPISQQIINQFNDQLEYKLVLGINNLLNPTTKKIKFLRGHGELDNADAWVVRDQLIKFYDVDTIRIKQIKSEHYNYTNTLSKNKYDSLITNRVDSIFIGNREVPVLDANWEPITNTERYIKNHFKNNILEEYYQDPLKVSEKLDVLNETDLLIVAKPTKPFSEKELFIIDQYIMNGGKIIWLVDMLDVNEGLLRDTSFTYAKPVNHQLQEYLFKYGARFNQNVINDVRCAPVIREDGLGKIPQWYFYPLLYNDTSSYLRNVGAIKARYACSIDTVGDYSLVKTPLLTTSDQYKTLRQTTVNYQNLYNYNPINFQIKETQTKPVLGWLFKGVFTSNFENRSISKEFQKFINTPSVNFKSKSDTTKMVFIGDGDLIRNDFVKQEDVIKPVFLDFESADYGNPSFFPKYGNSVFFLNMVDELLNREQLIPLRSKMNSPRLLKRTVLEQKVFWQFINIISPLILLILIGVINHIIRKFKYA